MLSLSDSTAVTYGRHQQLPSLESIIVISLFTLTILLSLIIIVIIAIFINISFSHYYTFLIIHNHT